MISGPTDARPIHIRVADDFRMQIESGEYAPGQQLPTLDVLAERYKCSLGVVRKAVDELKQQGLVVTLQGKGTFVRNRPTLKRHGIERYSRSRWMSGKQVLTAEIEAQGKSAGQNIRELGETPAPAAVAERLGVEPGTPVWARKRTTFIDDRPNQLADSYYKLETVEGTRIQEESAGPGGAFARLEEAGHHLAEIREEINARMPSTPESSELQLPPGTPVIDRIRTTFDDKGNPVEVMIAVMAADMVSMTYQFPIPD